MATGTIIFFHSRKGYGFIKTDDDSETDIFVHMDDVDGPDLNEAERVEFDIEDGPKGSRATNVKRLSDAE
jgi:CspA family cold shock protein